MWKSIKNFFSKFFRKEQAVFNRKFGWIRDEPDSRDLMFATYVGAKIYNPVDLRPGCPVIHDQGSLGACSAFGAISLVEYARKKQGFKDLWQPSPLFTYYVTRELQNTTQVDSGASVRYALKSVVKKGVTPEYTWPYIIEKFTEKPPVNVYSQAIQHQALSYRRLRDNSLDEMQACLEQGYPFIFGLQIYDSFVYCKKDGIIPIPKADKEFLHGGHCMMCVGWKFIKNKRYFIIQNSWSDKWGDKGYCYIPFEYMTMSRFAADFWMIRIMES